MAATNYRITVRSESRTAEGEVEIARRLRDAAEWLNVSLRGRRMTIEVEEWSGQGGRVLGAWIDGEQVVQ